MYIITATVNGVKYYYDGCYFSQNCELSETYFDVFEAMFEMISLGTQIHSSFRNLKVEEI